MKTKSIIILIFLFLGMTAFSQSKKDTVIRIKTSAVCSQCKDRIEQSMAYEKGIKDIVLDVDTKIVTVKFAQSKTTPTDIRRAISKIGYDADTIPADKAAYAKLPPCCKKDAPKHK